MHDRGVRRGARQPLGGEAVARQIFPRRIAQILGHPLALNAEHHDHIGPVHRLVDRSDRARQVVGHQRRRTGEPQLNSKPTEQLDVRPRHPAMLEVSADCDLQPGDPAEPLADRRGVEQRLGRMLADPVAGVDDRTIHDRRDTRRRADVAMTDNERIGAHCVERERRILERLALLDARPLDLHRDRLSAQPVGGDLERQQGARRIFEEGVDDRQPVEPPGIAPRLAIIGEPARALVEDEADLRVQEIVDREQVHEGVT